MKTNLRQIGLVLTITILSAININAQKATPWMLDETHTSVNFSINHFFSEVTGKFKEFNGKFNFDPEALNQSKIEFIVQIESVDTDNAKRDKHLLTKDFFNAEQFPEMKFISSKFEKKGANEYFMHGKLSIKDKTKTVKLPLKITGEMEHPMMEGTLILGLAIETSLDRTDYGVGTGDWAATMVVGDEVKINIPIELNRKK